MSLGINDLDIITHNTQKYLNIYFLFSQIHNCKTVGFRDYLKMLVIAPFETFSLTNPGTIILFLPFFFLHKCGLETHDLPQENAFERMKVRTYLVSDLC